MTESWWVAAPHREALEALAPLDIAAWMARAARGTVLSSDRQSMAVRVDAQGASWLVKWRHTLPARRTKTWGRPSRERRELRTAAAARARGIPALEAWAVGERRRFGRLVGSVLVRPFDAAARVALDVLPGAPAHAAALGTQVAGWHARGWRHGDAYAKNLLLLADGTTFAPIGHPHARFVAPRIGALDAGVQRDLAQAVLGLEALAGDLVRPFLAAYAAGAGRAPDVLRAALAPARGRILAKKAERLRTRPAREPDGPPQPRPLTARAQRVRVLHA